MFDYGGVLSEGGRAGTLNSIVQDHYGVKPDAEHLAGLHDNLRKGEICSEDFFSALNERYGGEPLLPETYLHRANYIPNAAEEVYSLADQLRRHDIRTGILSNVYRMSARRLRAMGRYDGFDPVLLSCDEGMAKPDEKFFEAAVERTGVAAQEIVFIDDQEKNLPIARKLGMMVVKSVNPKQVVKDVNDLIFRHNGIVLQAAA